MVEKSRLIENNDKCERSVLREQRICKIILKNSI